MSLLDKLDEFPPVICRLMARERRRALTLAQIAERAGVNAHRLAQILTLHSWATVSVGEASRLLQACGVADGRRFRLRAYLKRSVRSKQPFRHLGILGRQGVRRINEALKKAQEASAGEVPLT